MLKKGFITGHHLGLVDNSNCAHNYIFVAQAFVILMEVWKYLLIGDMLLLKIAPMEFQLYNSLDWSTKVLPDFKEMDI